MKGVLGVDNAGDQVFCFFREIEGLPRDMSAKGFIDLNENYRCDPESRKRLQALKVHLQENLTENTHHYPARWKDGGITIGYIDPL